MEHAVDPKVGNLLRRLVALHVPPADLERVLKSASMLLGSAISTAPSLQGLDTIVKSMLTRLVRDARHDEAQRFARLAATLKMHPDIDNEALWALLYLLSAMRSTARSALPRSNAPLVDGRSADAAFEPPLADRAAVPLQAPAESATHSVGIEEKVVRDLLLVVQGDDGKHLRLAGMEGEERIHFAPSITRQLSSPMKSVASAIAELGFLFRLIRRRTAEMGDGEHGLVHLNFANAVARELDSYYKSIMALRTAAADDKSLTLRALYRWAEDEKERLRILARLCEELRALRGGQVLAHLRIYRSSYLPPDIQSMLSRLFARAAAALNRMLVQWLTMGDIDDPHNEFFIMKDPKVAAAANVSKFDNALVADSLSGGPNSASMASHRIWWGLYKVRPAMLPTAHLKIAESALIAGKSVAFLRRCCNDAVWVESFHSPLILALMPSHEAMSKSNEMLGFDGLDALVAKAHESASKRLMNLFYGKFNLSHHFDAIKRYLLLSQGDFTQSLIDSLSKVLDSDGEVMLNSVTGLVDAALRSASSFNAATDNDVLHRLNVKIMMRDGERRLGWDIFSLTYRVEDAPLNTVFSSKVMDAYLAIFRFLWKLKRMDHLVNRAYIIFSAHKLTGSAAVADPARAPLLNALRKAHFVRMKMAHLVHNVEYYCTFEVLEGNWTTLERNMAAATNLSELIEAHARYLLAIKDRTMLSERCRGVLRALDASLDIIPEFYKVASMLCERLDAASRIVAPTTRKEQLAARARRAVAGESPRRGEEFQKLEDIEERFDKAFFRFLEVLREHAVQDDNCLFLAFRLDYNGYFGRRADQDLKVTSVD